jgi:hypothetical protein
MFLSKTSSGWPVAIVFRRQSEGMLKVKRMPFGLPSTDMSVDLLRGTRCLHELITCSREFDYTMESNGVDEIIRGNIESFMARPRCYAQNDSRAISSSEPRYYRFPFVPANSSMNRHDLFAHQFRRSSLLTWYVENSAAIIFIRITNNKGGSGTIVSRTNAASWSAPCSIEATLPSGNFQFTDAIDCLIFLRSSEEIKTFQTNKKMVVDITENLSDQMAVTKISDIFYIESRLKCVITPREHINQMMYSKVKNLDITRILDGKDSLLIPVFVILLQ